jgi:chromate transporter
VQLRLQDLAYYFVRLGGSKFGGPIALVSTMQKDLVVDRRWFSDNEFIEGLSYSQMMPGPVATQLAIYLGWLRFGIRGAVVAGISLVLIPFILVIGFSIFYQHFGDVSWIDAALYGIGACVIAIIAISAQKLAVRTLQGDRLLWLIAVCLALSTSFLEIESFWLFLFSGMVALFVKAPPKPKSAALFFPPSFLSGAILFFDENIWKLFAYFFKIGAVVFGSGMVIVPFLRHGVVKEFHWLTDRQFLDAISVGMITPGPLVITTAFIGYLVSGICGAFAASLGIFLPGFLLVVGLAPLYRRLTHSPQVRAFVAGITAAAVGAIAGAAVLLSKKNLVDSWTWIIAVLSFFILLRTKFPELLLILISGMIGYALHLAHS